MKSKTKNLDITALLQKETIVDSDFSQELSTSILNYAIEVISDRALPNVYDGLKPVQRRILWSCWSNKHFSNGPFVKCATLVGECMSYHSHGQMCVICR